MSTAQLLGLLTGVVFGFLLQRGGVLRVENQLNMLLLKDMTVMRFMLSAIMVGMVGIIVLAQFGVITLSYKPMNVGAVLVGGALFGVGWSFTGLCPGTSLGALGEGRLHALPVIAGMLVGAMLFAHTYDFMKSTVLSWKDYGPIGLPGVTGIPAFVFVAVFIVCAVLLLRFLDKKGL